MLCGIPKEEGIRNILAITQRNNKTDRASHLSKMIWAWSRECTASSKHGGGNAGGGLVVYYNTGSDYVFFPLAEVQSDFQNWLTLRAK